MAAELARTPLHVLLPEAYRQSAREIRWDFALYGATLVATLLLVRLAELALVG